MHYKYLNNTIPDGGVAPRHLLRLDRVTLSVTLSNLVTGKDLTWPSKRQWQWLLEKQPFKTIAVCRQVSAGWVEYLSPMEGTSPLHSSTPTKSPSMTSPKSSGQRCVSFSRLPQYGAGLPGDRLTIGILELFAILRCRILVVGTYGGYFLDVNIICYKRREVIYFIT